MATVRIQKYLSQCGIASRRKAEELIKKEEITVNGEIAKIGSTVSSEDIVKYNNKVVKPLSSLHYVALNKPLGYITSTKDQFGRKTVLDLVPKNINVYPVGRLDYNTTGLLLLTNDGELAYKLAHPKHETAKTYIVEITGNITPTNLTQLEQGVCIGSYLTKPATVKIIATNPTTLQLIIKEGKNRQIRKMIQAIDHKVITLKRVAIGNLQLGNLKQGDYKYLTKKEVTDLCFTKNRITRS
ncbi:MAG: rRNA pseudouridine synthase [Defluviitaleaceae bacterium]|nr:rRNA pseudouridine synthase [Defluviitaleaceae bacterium]